MCVHVMSLSLYRLCVYTVLSKSRWCVCMCQVSIVCVGIQYVYWSWCFKVRMNVCCVNAPLKQCIIASPHLQSNIITISSKHQFTIAFLIFNIHLTVTSVIIKLKYIQKTFSMRTAFI